MELVLKSRAKELCPSKARWGRARICMRVFVAMAFSLEWTGEGASHCKQAGGEKFLTDGVSGASTDKAVAQRPEHPSGQSHGQELALCRTRFLVIGSSPHGVWRLCLPRPMHGISNWPRLETAWWQDVHLLPTPNVPGKASPVANTSGPKHRQLIISHPAETKELTINNSFATFH